MATQIETEEEKKKRLENEAASLKEETPASYNSLASSYNTGAETTPLSSNSNRLNYFDVISYKPEVTPEPPAEFTSAGQAGRNVAQFGSDVIGGIGNFLTSAYNAGKNAFNQYSQQEGERQYNAAVDAYNQYANTKNIGKAGIEFGAGVAGVPVDLGRSDYMSPVEYSGMEKPTTNKSQPPPDRPKTIQQEMEDRFGGFENVPVKKAEQANAYSVVFPNNYTLNKVFGNQKEAQDYFESMGGSKGTPGGIITLSGKNSKTKAENVAFSKQREDEQRIQSRQEAKERLAKSFEASGGRSMWDDAVAAREAENKANRESGAKFRSDVAARRSALDAYNNYNNDMSLLNRAYREAKSKKDFGTAFAIKQRMNRESVGVPKEEGAKQKFFESGQFAERELMRQQEANRLQEEEDNRRRLVASNPFAANYGFNRL